MDNWTVPRLPESVAARTFKPSKRGLALPRQRSKDRRGRRDFGTAETRWRDAAWWRNEKRNAQRFVLVQSKSQTVEATRAQSRKGRICRPGAEDFSRAFGQSESRLRSRSTKIGLGTAGRQEVGPRDQFRPLTEPAPARAPGEWKPTLNARKSFSEPASRRRAAKYPSGSTSRREWGRPQGRPHFSFWGAGSGFPGPRELAPSLLQNRKTGAIPPFRARQPVLHRRPTAPCHR